MNYNPFLFVKDNQCRYTEFTKILSNLRTEVKKSWSAYIELAFEPVGWRAFWKISRKDCKYFNIHFPCTAIVMVERINYEDLTCDLAVVEVESENIHLPAKVFDVPLIELYPTKEQDGSSALSLYETANLIDALRFFMRHLWMPWDQEFEEDPSWIDNHLQNRLKLYFAMAEKKVPNYITWKVRELIAEGREVQRMMDGLRDAEHDLSARQMLDLMELYNRLSQLKNTFTIYEAPELLTALIEKQEEEEFKVRSSECLVLYSTTSEHLLNLGNKMYQILEPSKRMRVLPTLMEALIKTPPGGSVRLTRGDHHILWLANFEGGGSITGLESEVVVCDGVKEDGHVCLDVEKGSLTLSNLSVNMTSTIEIIKVHPGAKCVLKNVMVTGLKHIYGITVLPNAHVVASHCHFDGCEAGLVAQPNSTVTLTDCTFSDNSVALQLSEGCHFSMVGCSINNSSQCAVKLTTSSLTPQNCDITTIDQINRLPNIKEESTVLENNVECLQVEFAARNGQDLDSEEMQVDK